jgi:hypothetical protein
MRWLGLVVALGLAGCNHWAEVRTPVPELLEDFPPPRLRLTAASGQSVVMLGAGIHGDRIAGLIERQTRGEAVLSSLLGISLMGLAPGSIAVQDLVRVDVRKPSVPARMGAVVLTAAGAAAAAVLMVKLLGSFRGIANTPMFVVRLP